MESLLTSVADYLISQSWQMTVVLALVAATCWGLRKASAHWRYLLWLIVVAKCVTPGLVSVPLAVLPQKTESSDAPRVAIPGSQTGAVSLSSTRANQRRPSVEDARSVPVPYPPELGQPSAVAEAEIVIRGPEAASAPAGTAQADAVAMSGIRGAMSIPSMELSLRARLAMTWLAGVALFLTCVLIGAWKTHRRLMRVRRMADPAIRTMVAALAGRLGLKRAPTTYTVPTIAQPFVWGWPRGSIYLPEQFVDRMSREQQEAILAHELAHVARWDAAVNVVQILMQAGFFFHPFV